MDIGLKKLPLSILQVSHFSREPEKLLWIYLKSSNNQKEKIHSKVFFFRALALKHRLSNKKSWISNKIIHIFI